jgi:hypothetical protein
MMKYACMMSIATLAVAQAAGLDFPNPLKELHAPADAKVVTAEFEFTNRTNKPVQIMKYDAACSCMALKIKDSKLRYAPGESGLLRADFEMGNFSGTVDKVVALWLDDDPADKPSVRLTVRVHIPVLVSLEPKTLKWELNGDGEPQTIRITMNHTEPIRVTSVNSSSPTFLHEIKTVEEGKVYELIVTPAEIDSPGLGILRIETDCAIAQHRLQQAFAVIRKPTPGEAATKP